MREDEFTELAAAHQSELRAHCYRMLGSVQDAEDAMERGDIEALIGMLTREVTWSMPPVPTWYQGLATVKDFLVRYPLTDRWKHRPAQANSQLAVAGYVYDEDVGRFIPASIDVLTLDRDKIAAVTGFLTADLLSPENAAGWISGADLFAASASRPIPRDPRASRLQRRRRRH